jgi:hypothetical protein
LQATGPPGSRRKARRYRPDGDRDNEHRDIDVMRARQCTRSDRRIAGSNHRGSNDREREFGRIAGVVRSGKVIAKNDVGKNEEVVASRTICVVRYDTNVACRQPRFLVERTKTTLFSTIFDRSDGPKLAQVRRP